MINIGEECEIKSYIDLVFNCLGFASQSTILNETQDGLQFINNCEDDSLVQNIFIKIFIITKCTNLCNRVNY